eukprot:CAMPEP_0185206692 /NCGR_PEP_ID=MMETSP1140-20130426/58932_1 /TAXON_ID=298111 /ORGANISM="Pavlova sp., Strain CCMP459" /LENGTH=30 /DNA_ID= /DNA_START= /DNA_END= /DNA_ORIENTATION=
MPALRLVSAITLPKDASRAEAAMRAASRCS